MTITDKVVDELCKLDLLTLDKVAKNISTFVKAQTRKAKSAAKSAAAKSTRRSAEILTCRFPPTSRFLENTYR